MDRNIEISNIRAEIITIQKEYIEFLSDALSKSNSIYVSRPYMNPASDEDIERGKDIRSRISKLEKSISDV